MSWLLFHLSLALAEVSLWLSHLSRWLARPVRPVGCGRPGRPLRDDAGQASAEYALVLLGAAAVALLVTAWATHTDAVKTLFDAVFKHLLGRVR
jgi:Flp pilus assembly pilin Flp